MCWLWWLEGGRRQQWLVMSVMVVLFFLHKFIWSLITHDFVDFHTIVLLFFFCVVLHQLHPLPVSTTIATAAISPYGCHITDNNNNNNMCCCHHKVCIFSHSLFLSYLPSCLSCHSNTQEEDDDDGHDGHDYTPPSPPPPPPLASNDYNRGSRHISSPQ